MKLYKNFSLVFLIILIIFTLFSTNVAAYSYSIRRFIEQDKHIRILLHNGLIKYSFTPLNSVEVMSLGEDPVNINLNGGKYKIKIDNTVDYWFIQVFATGLEKKAKDIKEELHKQGYENITINSEEELYKIILPGMKNKQQAEKLKDQLASDGWNPWLRKMEKSSKEKSLCLLNSSDDILCRGINIKIKGDIISGDIKFPGEFEFMLRDNGIKVFNTVNINSVLLGMLCSQFSRYNDVTPDMLKAQTVINRTYILNKFFSDKNSYKSIVFYRGIYGDDLQLRKALNATEGQVLSSFNSGRVDLINIPENRAELDVNYREILKQFSDKKIVDLTQTTEEKIIVDSCIVDGLKYREIRQLTWWGPRVLTVIDMDFNKNNLTVNTHLADDKIPGLVDLMETVRKERALAGINGGFFTYTGRPLGFLMIEGIVASEPLKNRTTIGITDKGKVLYDSLQWRGVICDKTGKNIAYITGVNRKPANDEIVIYNKYYGRDVTFTHTTVQLFISGNTIVETTAGVEGKISADKFDYIIQARGNKKEIINRYKAGDDIEYRDDFSPDSWDKYNIISAMEAGPRLLKNGQIYISAKQGGFQNDIINGRAPRSAVGTTADGHLVFVTVDGRQPELSIGMKLSELAAFMKDYGIEDAMNLDGGGSARMVVRGYTMNNPSQKRLIASEFLIKIKGNQY